MFHRLLLSLFILNNNVTSVFQCIKGLKGPIKILRFLQSKKVFFINYKIKFLKLRIGRKAGQFKYKLNKRKAK